MQRLMLHIFTSINGRYFRESQTNVSVTEHSKSWIEYMDRQLIYLTMRVNRLKFFF